LRHVVVGARQMGGGIAQVVAASGRRVSLYDPFINEAVSALADGVASADGIDTVAKLGFARPIGPLAHLIGLDTLVSIMEVLEQGLGDEKYAPHPLLREHVAAGRLGRKSGAGFFEYR
jgi:3-hydroxybutyryl-CoA dehydrogenase